MLTGLGGFQVAWGFDAHCLDCDHHWEGVQATLYIGPSPRAGDNSQNLFCRRCYNRLWLPDSLDRNAWRRWYEQFLTESSNRSEWLLALLATIDTSFTAAGWYTPLPIDPGVVECPDCGIVMVLGEPDGDHLECPACGSLRAVLAGFHSHYSLTVGENGFQ